MMPELRLVAENNTDTYLTDVRIELTFDDDRIVRLDSKPDVFDRFRHVTAETIVQSVLNAVLPDDDESSDEHA
jgi:hypothetical protein